MHVTHISQLRTPVVIIIWIVYVCGLLWLVQIRFEAIGIFGAVEIISMMALKACSSKKGKK